MRLKHIYIYFTSLSCCLLSLFNLNAQKSSTDILVDSIPKAKEFYGLRIGVDISKPIRSLIDEDYSGLELVGDFRIRKNYYLAAELGNEQRTSDLPNIENTTSGSYIKAGFNYNAYDNWFGMNNLIYAGVRAGFATYSQELENFTVSTNNTIFPDDTRTESQEFTGLNASWLELKFGLEVELFSNIYLGINVQLKRSITTTEPDGFANLFIPGFGKVTEESSIGVGYGYTISYLIPIFKR